MLKYSIKFFSLSLFFIFSHTHVSYSLPPTTDECLKARSDHQVLVESGIRDDIAKGYKQAASNLSKERLQKIKKWFELQELIVFRCPKIKSQKVNSSPLKETVKVNDGVQKIPPSSKTDEKVPQTSSVKKDT